MDQMGRFAPAYGMIGTLMGLIMMLSDMSDPSGIGAGMAEELFEYYRNQEVENVYTSVRWDSTDLLSFFKTLGFDRSNFINLRKVVT